MNWDRLAIEQTSSTLFLAAPLCGCEYVNIFLAYKNQIDNSPSPHLNCMIHGPKEKLYLLLFKNGGSLGSTVLFLL
jgi:hypothetical protein